MRRFGRLADRVLGCFDIADIAVFERLAPAPAAGFLEHENPGAIMVVGVERRVRGRHAGGRRAPPNKPRRPPLDKAPRFYLPAQPRIGEILVIGIESRVERHHGMLPITACWSAAAVSVPGLSQRSARSRAP